MIPIVRPPFYAIACEPVLINTQGGPKRNAKAQVMDVNGNPIKQDFTVPVNWAPSGGLYIPVVAI